MKRVILGLAIAAAMLCGGTVEGQRLDVKKNVRYDKYFEDATLRIDYHRIGNRQHDTVEVASSRRLGQWAGSLTQLQDPFDNGEYRVEVRDVKKGRVLYSRSYNSLFQEYRDTPQGRDSVVSMEEVLRVPYPKGEVEICWRKRGEDRRYHDQYVWLFKPGMEQQAAGEARTPQAMRQYEGDIHKKLDVVIVPEGYGPGDTLKMRAHLEAFKEHMLAQEPFKSRRADFNVWMVCATGEASGITDPNKGIFVNSLVGSSYNTFGSDRYLMTMNLFKLHDAIGDIPCDQIIIMANSTTYGGGAIYNFYAMSSMNRMANMILVHELGHSIGGLADEYVDEDLSYSEMHAPDYEPTEPNITTLVDFGSKWQALVPEGTPIPTPMTDDYTKLGVYEGAGYHSKGVYRPVSHCMMRDYAPFCPVCSQRLNDIFDLYTK